ncbi:MAG: toprim domain-containing protein [Minisyncoccia bacterium]
MDPAQKLIKIFAEFPGIGPKQAKRFVYFLLTRPRGYVEEISKLFSDLKRQMKICSECYRYFNSEDDSVTAEKICKICANKNRDISTLFVVSRDVDFENVERSGGYKGRYFIVGGTIPILDKEPEKKIRIKELVFQVEKMSQNGLKEVILGLDANTEGQYTEDYIRGVLSPLSAKFGFKISTLGRGLSTGTELEYSDSDTIKSAIGNRR